MKVRTGFVSNSSSTNFFFLLKRKNKKAFIDTLMKYQDKFEIYDDYFRPGDIVPGSEVINNIKKLIYPDYRSNKPYEHIIPIEPLKNLTGELLGDIKHYKRELEKIKNNYEDASWEEFVSSNLRMKRSKLEKLKCLQEKGFEYYVVVGFGDNEGDIEGGVVGCGMYGVDMKINKSDLVVFTEQNN